MILKTHRRNDAGRSAGTFAGLSVGYLKDTFAGLRHFTNREKCDILYKYPVNT